MPVFLFILMLVAGFSGQFWWAIGLFVLAILAQAWETR